MGSVVKNNIEITGLSDNIPDRPVIFKEVCLTRNILLKEGMPDIVKVVKLMVEINITTVKVDQSRCGISLEGQNLTGAKIVVEGEVQHKIEYKSASSLQSVHAICCSSPFVTFIALPDSFCISTPVIVTGFIEDAFVEPVDKRGIYESILLLLDVAL